MSILTNLVILAGHLPTVDIPDPGATAPPGGNNILGIAIGYGKWAAIAIGVLAIIGAGISLTMARRGHGEGTEHAQNIGRIVLGIGIALMAVGIVTVIVTGLGVG